MDQHQRQSLMRQLFLTLAEAMGARENVRAIHNASRGLEYRMHDHRAYDRQYRHRKSLAERIDAAERRQEARDEKRHHVAS